MLILTEHARTLLLGLLTISTLARVFLTGLREDSGFPGIEVVERGWCFLDIWTIMLIDHIIKHTCTVLIMCNIAKTGQTIIQNR